MLSTSTSQLARVPNSCVHVPMRPYTAAVSASASSRARRLMVAALIAVALATASGGNSRATRSTSSTPATNASSRPRSTSPSAKSTCTMAMSRRASVPGRMGTCSLASSAVLVRLGSTTTTRPPRSMMRRRRPGQSGAVARLPLDSKGLAPSIRRYDVRSRSGTAKLMLVPKRRPLLISLGRWSIVLAEYTFVVPSARTRKRLYRTADRLWTVGLPR